MASNLTEIESDTNKNNDVATLAGSIESLKTQDNCSVDQPDNEGYTPLHIIYTKYANGQDEETIKMLVALGADVHTKAKDGSTIFHSAVQKNKPIKLLECLTAIHDHDGENIEPGKHKEQKFSFRDDVNYMDKEGHTPVHLIVKKSGKADQDNAVLQLLISLGADVNIKIKRSGYTALMLAVDNLNLDMAKILINGGADVNAHTRTNQNALHLILSKNCYGDPLVIITAIAKLLIDSGIGMDAVFSNQTALHMALFQSDEITRYLIQNGASVNIGNAKGETVLHRAIQSNKHDIVKLLLKQ